MNTNECKQMFNEFNEQIVSYGGLPSMKGDRRQSNFGKYTMGAMGSRT